MLALIVQTALLLLTGFFLVLIYRAYRVSGAYQLKFLEAGLLVTFLSLLMDISARLQSDPTLAEYLFRAYAFLVPFALLFFMAYVEFSRHTKPSWRLYMFILFIGFTSFMRAAADFDVYSSGGFVTRTAFVYEIFGVDISSLFVNLAVIWLFIELLLLTRKQMKITRREYVYRTLQLFEIVVLTGLLFLSVGLVLYYLGYIAAIVLNVPLIIVLIGLVLVNFKIPTISYLSSQRTYGVLVYNDSGLLITKYVVDRELENYASLLGGFISAIMSAVKEIIGFGDLKTIELGNRELVISRDKDFIVVLIVDKRLPLHISLANRIRSELAKRKIIRSNIAIVNEQAVLNVIQKYIEPLFP